MKSKKERLREWGRIFYGVFIVAFILDIFCDAEALTQLLLQFYGLIAVREMLEIVVDDEQK